MLEDKKSEESPADNVDRFLQNLASMYGDEVIPDDSLKIPVQNHLGRFPVHNYLRIDGLSAGHVSSMSD